MRSLRQTCAATILTLALSVFVLAGQIQCPGAPAPPPPTQSSVVTTILLAIVSLVR
jgi:hypothetical protein